jgi:hypothetical protein
VKTEARGTMFTDPPTPEAVLMAETAKREAAANISGNTQFAWLIETDGPYYIYADKIGGGARFGWTQDHSKAIRFARKCDADDALDALRETLPKLFDFPTMQGAKPVEHGWS